MQSISKQHLRSVSLSFAASIHTSSVAYTTKNKREVLYIPTCKVYGVSLGDEPGDGVIWLLSLSSSKSF
jgi:hypothetical protein